jgi:hypothetical protein
VSGNRSDNDAFGTRRNKAIRESGIDGYLRCGVIACEIAEKRWRVGMHNRHSNDAFLLANVEINRR